MAFANTEIPLPPPTPSTAPLVQADDEDSDATPAVDVDSDSTANCECGASSDAITVMTTAQVDAFTPYTYFASAGYCKPAVTKTWTCGANCNANPGFKPIASGGDGSKIQYWYVGYDPTLKTIIVAHQGTDRSEFLALLTDINFKLAKLSSSLFPGIPSSVKVHSGFKKAHERAAADVLAAVRTGVETYETKSVTPVGHSLGAALSLLDSVFLPLHIPGLTVTYYGYGLPRVGNKHFANYVDSKLCGRFTRITNLKDPIPILPGKFLGFRHPAGEAHINTGEVWKWCPGQDNSDVQCSIGNIPNIFESDLGNHNGPYNGIKISCSS